MTAADFDAVVQTHLCGAAYIVRAAWDQLRASDSGRVLFTTSATGLYGQFGQANYGAAKAGLIGLMDVLKVEGARAGICLNTIAPVARARMTHALLPVDAAEGLGPERVPSRLLSRVGGVHGDGPDSRSGRRTPVARAGMRIRSGHHDPRQLRSFGSRTGPATSEGE